MEIGLTTKLQTRCKIKSLPPTTENNLFFCWDVHVGMINGRKILFIANSNNRMGCVVCGMKESAYKNISEYVCKNIKILLQKEGYTDSEINEYFCIAGEVRLTKTHGRKSVGACNQALADLMCAEGLELKPHEEYQTGISSWINQMLGKSAGYNDNYYTPYETFFRDMESIGINPKIEKCFVVKSISEYDYDSDKVKCFIASMDGLNRRFVSIPKKVITEKGIKKGDLIKKDFFS